MRRREFLGVLAGATAWPLAARAQQPALPVIGFVNVASAQHYVPLLSAFLKGLSEAGFVDGRNVSIEYRWAQGRFDRLRVWPAIILAGFSAAISRLTYRSSRALKSS
jgi:hypothetical protein